MLSLRSLLWVCILVAVFSVLFSWPLSAQTGNAPDRLTTMDQKLDRLEKQLGQITEQLRRLENQKPGWQKLSEPNDKGEYILMMDSATGKVKAIRKSDGVTYDR